MYCTCSRMSQEKNIVLLMVAQDKATRSLFYLKMGKITLNSNRLTHKNTVEPRFPETPNNIIIQTKTDFPSLLKQCNFTPDFSNLPIIGTQEV